ncbi:Hypothetical predicted protein [Cloeon dipterum]|uniref:Uncharacterized protein n=1 Tax=Cloeon dipterum TaxID=197152 RepID=A0A8S1DM14_9INSE|nr:Hypothetical predicted protein [Cloeon dipterum]
MHMGVATCENYSEEGLVRCFGLKFLKFKMSSDEEDENRFTLCSLKTMAIDTVIENIGCYKDLIAKINPSSFRKVLFDIAMERRLEIGEDQLWAALPYLDQHRMTEFFSTRDFPTIFHIEDSEGVLHERENSMEEFLQFIVKFVPNLRELIIEDPSNFWDEDLQLQTLLPSSIKQICLMENLVDITFLDIYIKISGFYDVSTKCKKLATIKANNILCDMERDSTKMSLEALNSLFDHHEYDEQKFPRKICIKLLKGRPDEPYRRVLTSLSNDFLDLIPQNLTHLKIVAPIDLKQNIECNRLLPEDLNRDFKCKKLSFRSVLTKFGANLKALKVEDLGEEEDISLKDISELCSNLENLEICDSNVTNDDEDLTSFSKLKTLGFSIRHSYMNDGGHQTISLKNILSLPLLEEISVKAEEFDLGDTQELFKRIKNREILTHLREFNIDHYAIYDPDVHKLFELQDVIQSVYPRVVIVIETCISHLAFVFVFAVVPSNHSISTKFKMIEYDADTDKPEEQISLQNDTDCKDEELSSLSDTDNKEEQSTDEDCDFKEQKYVLEKVLDKIEKDIDRYKELTKLKISSCYEEAMHQMDRKGLGKEKLLAAFPDIDAQKIDEYWLLEVKLWKIAVPFYAASVKKFLDQFAPNLQQLDIQYLAYSKNSNSHIDLELNANVTDFFCKMKNLTHISIREAFIEFSEFVRISRECKNLQEIEANRITVDVNPESMRMILETVDSAFNHQEYTDWDFPYTFGIIFKKTDAVELYRKANVQVWPNIGPYILDSIPELTHLEVIEHDPFIDNEEKSPLQNENADCEDEDQLSMQETDADSEEAQDSEIEETQSSLKDTNNEEELSSLQEENADGEDDDQLSMQETDADSEEEHDSEIEKTQSSMKDTDNEEEMSSPPEENSDYEDEDQLSMQETDSDSEEAHDSEIEETQSSQQDVSKEEVQPSPQDTDAECEDGDQSSPQDSEIKEDQLSLQDTDIEEEQSSLSDSVDEEELFSLPEIDGMGPFDISRHFISYRHHPSLFKNRLELMNHQKKALQDADCEDEDQLSIQETDSDSEEAQHSEIEETQSSLKYVSKEEVLPSPQDTDAECDDGDQSSPQDSEIKEDQLSLQDTDIEEEQSSLSDSENEEEQFSLPEIDGMGPFDISRYFISYRHHPSLFKNRLELMNHHKKALQDVDCEDEDQLSMQETDSDSEEAQDSEIEETQSSLKDTDNEEELSSLQEENADGEDEDQLSMQETDADSEEEQVSEIEETQSFQQDVSKEEVQPSPQDTHAECEDGDQSSPQDSEIKEDQSSLQDTDSEEEQSSLSDSENEEEQFSLPETDCSGPLVISGPLLYFWHVSSLFKYKMELMNHHKKALQDADCEDEDQLSMQETDSDSEEAQDSEIEETQSSLKDTDNEEEISSPPEENADCEDEHDSDIEEEQSSLLDAYNEEQQTDLIPESREEIWSHLKVSVS